MPFDEMLMEIGNYSKGWYGTFTGAGRTAYDELPFIIRHLCGIGQECKIPDRDVFQLVADTFHEVAVKRHPETNWMYREMWKEAIFPWFVIPAIKDDSTEVRILNRMLIGIGGLAVKDFPYEKMVMSKTIARFFPNGEERIARRIECGFEIKD